MTNRLIVKRGKMKNILLIIALFFFGLLGIRPLEAEMLVSNFDSPPSNSFPVVSSDQSLAQAFTTGHLPSRVYGISVNFRIYEQMDGPIQFSIHEDLQGLPGALVPDGELPGIEPDSAGMSVNLDFISEGIELEADSSYWVIASDTDNDTIIFALKTYETLPWPSFPCSI